MMMEQMGSMAEWKEWQQQLVQRKQSGWLERR